MGERLRRKCEAKVVERMLHKRLMLLYLNECDGKRRLLVLLSVLKPISRAKGREGSVRLKE